MALSAFVARRAPCRARIEGRPTAAKQLWKQPAPPRCSRRLPNRQPRARRSQPIPAALRSHSRFRSSPPGAALRSATKTAAGACLLLELDDWPDCAMTAPDQMLLWTWTFRSNVEVQGAGEKRRPVSVWSGARLGGCWRRLDRARRLLHLRKAALPE
jgi:hypothetical protein